VSVARIDDEAGRFEIAAAAGADLLAPGTALPVSTCSYFAEAAQGRSFSDADFDASDRFARPLDGVVLASGFHAGCSVPIRRAGRAIGAVSLSATSHGLDMARTATRVEAVVGALAAGVQAVAGGRATRVLVCHPDALAARGIARLLEQDRAARTSVAATLDEAVATATAAPPDVLVCDDWIDGLRVDEVARRLGAAGVEAPIVVLSSHDTPESLRASLAAGAAARVVRRDAVRALPVALAAVLAGDTVPPGAGLAADDAPRLTPREYELLRVLEEGLRFKQAAIRLGISVATAKTHARSIFRKLDATSRTEALRTARRRGLLG